MLVGRCCLQAPRFVVKTAYGWQWLAQARKEERTIAAVQDGAQYIKSVRSTTAVESASNGWGGNPKKTSSKAREGRVVIKRKSQEEVWTRRWSK